MQFKKPILVFFSIVSVFSFSFRCSRVVAQTAPNPSIESPNAASLGKYGDIPVSYFTGVPQISFPIYNINVGGINLPISLSYHPGSVRPNEHAGWVGLGWNVSAYGSITRKYHYDDDERDVQTPVFPAYYPDPYTTSYGASFINTTDWETPARLYYVNTVNNSKGYDVEPDEFSFNFGKYSGSFFYTANGWQVVSENPNVKVEILGFLSATEVRNNISGYTAGTISVNSFQSRQFSGFILTTEDGTKYTFGYIAATGSDVNCGVEFSALYGTSPGALIYGANTWLLRKVEDINGEVVTFDYQKKNPVCALACYSSEMNYVCITNTGSTSNGTSLTTFNNQINTAKHNGQLIYPVYLKRITSSKEIVDFTISETTELRYTDDFFKYDNGIALDLGAIGTNNDPSNLKWYKLDDIAVRNKKNDIVSKFKFTYNNVATERLTLSSFAEQDRIGNNVKTYQFFYNNIAGLPPYGGDQTDHWGFYNGVLMNGRVISSAATYRNTNSALAATGLLTSVVYPTGGKTDYVWESNKAANVVAYDRQSITPYSPGFVGGARIKEIWNYANPAASPLITKYFYVKNFTTGVDPLTLPSSGILNGTPEYYFSIPTRTSYPGGVSLSYDIASFNSLVNYSYNGSFSHIGYSEVVEQKPDNSYSRYFFTNFDQDMNGQTHWDKKPAVLGWVLTGSAQDRYVPMSSLERERGKLLKSAAYKNNNTLLTDTRLYYRSDTTRFDNFIKRYDRNRTTPISCSAADAFMLVSAFKTFLYNYYVVKKEETNYDMNGLNPLLKTTEYTYNSFDQLSQLTETTNGRKLITRYKYPSDFNITTATLPEVLALQAMKTRNIVGVPVEEQNLQEVNAVQTVIGGKLNKYKDFGSGLLKLSEQLGIELTSPSSNLTAVSINASNQLAFHPSYKSKVLFDSYEANGNLNQVHKTDDINISRLWDYNNALPVAEVKNAAQGQFAACSFEAEGSGKWSFTGIPIQDITAPTGRMAYSFTSTTPITKTGLTAAKVYVLSYWRPTTATALTVAGTVAGSSLTGRTVNGWQYFEQKITGQTTVTLSAASGLIDEVRLYPSDAQLTTYTYDPLVGITSICDPNNNITYYEYDGFGRLALIRDLDRNVIKKYCYNYDLQTENCNIYYNEIQTGTYNKSNCAPCYTGSAVTYTVPANKYLSTNSLAEANSLALSEVAANGQAYADQNGTCTAIPSSLVNSTNNISSTVTVTFYDASIPATYTYSATVGNKIQNAFLPCGTYRVTMHPGTSGTYTYIMYPGGSIRTSADAVFNSVFIPGPVNIVIAN